MKRALAGKCSDMSEHEASQVVQAPSQQVFEVVSDLRRLPEWLPTVRRAEATPEGEAHLEGSAGRAEHYESEGFWRPSPEQLRVEWGTPSRAGEPGEYAGWLQVADRDEGSEVTVHLSFFDDGEPPTDVDEGLEESLRSLASLVS